MEERIGPKDSRVRFMNSSKSKFERVDGGPSATSPGNPSFPHMAGGVGLSQNRGENADANRFIAKKDDLILITGASGFIGSRLVNSLLDLGFQNIRCFVRSSSNRQRVKALTSLQQTGARVEIIKGNLLSADDCFAATQDAVVIFHLAAGRGEKSYPDAFMNSVVTTRNLLEASMHHRCLKRFVNISSFSVYSNTHKPDPRLLDENCPVEPRPALRGEAYCFAKAEQDQIVIEYGKRLGIPYVIVRPGQVYGPGNEGITGRVGINTFGFFLHLGGSNTIPFTYVDNCVDAIALAGLTKGVDGEIFNVVDDDLPSSRVFLRLYKKNVRDFRSLYVPHAVSYALCYLWERYSSWSEEQLPPSFNRSKWNAFWKKTTYSNEKLKSRVGWSPKVRTEDGMKRFFESCRAKDSNA
jgi:nucleoside-diphosphate-sugar epimerase